MVGIDACVKKRKEKFWWPKQFHELGTIAMRRLGPL